MLIRGSESLALGDRWTDKQHLEINATNCVNEHFDLLLSSDLQRVRQESPLKLFSSIHTGNTLPGTDVYWGERRTCRGRSLSMTTGPDGTSRVLCYHLGWHQSTCFRLVSKALAISHCNHKIQYTPQLKEGAWLQVVDFVTDGYQGQTFSGKAGILSNLIPRWVRLWLYIWVYVYKCTHTHTQGWSKVRSGCPIRCYGKTQMNFLANLIYMHA